MLEVVGKVHARHSARPQLALDPIAVGQRLLQPLEEFGHPNRLRPKVVAQQYGAL